MIPLGIKGPETRGWSTPHRGPLAICATATIPGLRRGETLTVGDYEIENDTTRGSRPQYLMRGPKLAWPYRLPLGAVVATCELVDVVPIRSLEGDQGFTDNRVVDMPLFHGLHLLHSAGAPAGYQHELIEDQLPYGDFTPGRYAWLLDNVHPIEPIPVVGRQGLWNWDTSALAIAEGITA